MQCFAGRVVAVFAVFALGAGDVVADKDPLARFVFFGMGLDDVSGYFMAQDPRGFFDPVPFHDIGTADPARPDLDKDLAFTDLGLWAIFDPDIAVIVINSYFHEEVYFAEGL